MRYLLILLPCLIATALLPGQDHSIYTDRIDVRGGRDRTGTITEYLYGQHVTIDEGDGRVTTVPWRRIASVNFTLDREELARREDPGARAQDVATPPDRGWRHQITTTTGFSRSPLAFNQFGGLGQLNVGAGAAYHYVRPLGKLVVGAGGGAEVMSPRNNERVVLLTGLAEYQVGNGRIRPLLRLLVGGNLPLGHPDLEFSERRIGSVAHPALGLALHPPRGRWGTLLFDVGYRFTRVAFRTQNQNFELVDRRINYRRLIFTLGTRF